MKKILFILLMFILPAASALRAQTTQVDTLEIEALVDPDTDSLIVAIDENRIYRVWAEMLLRGTSGIAPFDSALFNKYYYRIVLRSDGTIDTVYATENFRAHQAQPGITKAWDVPKVNLQRNVKQILRDIMLSNLWPKIPIDSVTGLKKVFHWPWGRVERKRFAPIKVGGFTKTQLRNLLAPDTVGFDSTGAPILTKPRITIRRDSLISAFGLNRTLAQVLNDPNEATRLKQWIIRNLINKGIADTTKLITIFKNRERSKIFLRWKSAKKSWFVRH